MEIELHTKRTSIKKIIKAAWLTFNGVSSNENSFIRLKDDGINEIITIINKNKVLFKGSFWDLCKKLQ